MQNRPNILKSEYFFIFQNKQQNRPYNTQCAQPHAADFQRSRPGNGDNFPGLGQLNNRLANMADSRSCSFKRQDPHPVRFPEQDWGCRAFERMWTWKIGSRNPFNIFGPRRSSSFFVATPISSESMALLPPILQNDQYSFASFPSQTPPGQG